jgi:ribose 5-phosphate isomerase B
MTIFIGADHRGFELKNQLIEYLQEKNIRVEDMGAYGLEPQDDYPVFGKKVAQAVLQNPEEFLGILICGSGAGVDIAANRFRGVRCGLGFDEAQIKHIRENDHVNVLAIASDYVNFEKAKRFVDIFIGNEPKQDDKYVRRTRELDQIEEKTKPQS